MLLLTLSCFAVDNSVRICSACFDTFCGVASALSVKFDESDILLVFVLVPWPQDEIDTVGCSVETCCGTTTGGAALKRFFGFDLAATFRNDFGFSSEKKAWL